MRKNSIVMCCVTFCLLSAVPGNQGAKLLESLSCFRPFPQNIMTCTWLENNVSEKLVNLTLKELDENKTECQNKTRILPTHSTWISPTHSTWTCNFFWGQKIEAAEMIFSFFPDRNLETRLNISEERDEAKPQNLQYVDIDGNITFSWLIRKEIAESIDFALFYDHDKKECQPKCQQEISEYLNCHCNITTNDQLNTSALLKTISVKPSKPETSSKSFRRCLIYQLPPRNLTINETEKGKIFYATWENTTPESTDFLYQYELCYWNQDDLKVSDVCPGEVSVIENNHNPGKIFKLEEQLKPSSNYSMKVRVRLIKTEKRCYQGPWSHWSNVETLTTKAVPNLILLSVLIPVCVIIFVTFALCGYKALIRYKKEWDERIPDPNKSTIIKGFQNTKGSIVNEPCFPYEEHLYVEPYNNISMWTSSVSKESQHIYHNEEHISKLDSELIQDEDTESFILCDLTKDYPTASIVDGYKPLTDLTDEQENKNIENSQFTFSAFDGPYLFS